MVDDSWHQPWASICTHVHGHLHTYKYAQTYTHIHTHVHTPRKRKKNVRLLFPSISGPQSPGDRHMPSPSMNYCLNNTINSQILLNRILILNSPQPASIKITRTYLVLNKYLFNLISWLIWVLTIMYPNSESHKNLMSTPCKPSSWEITMNKEPCLVPRCCL